MPKNLVERRDITVLQALSDINNKLAKQGEDLAVNTVETRNIRDRMDKLNGSISNHDARLNGIEKNQSLITQTLAAVTKKEDGQSDMWRRWSDKVIWAAIIVLSLLFYSVLVQSGVISNFLRH